MNDNKMTIATLCEGRLQENVDRALMRIAENILDPRCDPEVKRKMKITITMKAEDGDPDDITVESAVDVTLASEIGSKSKLSIRRERETGMMNIQEYKAGVIMGQLAMDEVLAQE